MEEPFLFHTVPHTLFEELIHSMDAVAVIALAGDGKAALAALQMRIPFFGLSFTPEHSAWLAKRLEGQVFKKYQDATSKLHQPGLTILLGNNVADAGAEVPKAKAKPPTKRVSEGQAVGCLPARSGCCKRFPKSHFLGSNARGTNRPCGGRVIFEIDIYIYTL